MQTTGASDAEAPERHIGGPQRHVRAFSRFGRAIFQALFMRDMAGGSYRPWLARTFEPELLSMNLLMAGMAPTIKILATRIQSAGAAIALLPRQPWARRGNRAASKKRPLSYRAPAPFETVCRQCRTCRHHVGRRGWRWRSLL